jgi:DNA polymerase-3 subunit gamma/tau
MVLLRLLAFKPKSYTNASNLSASAPASAEKKTSELASTAQSTNSLQSAQSPQPQSQSQQAKPSEEFLSVPIPSKPTADASTLTLAKTPEGDFWNQLVREMVEAQAINALVRELALQSQLMTRNNNQWTLQVDKDSLNTPSNCERLQAALAQFGHEVQLSVVMGAVEDSTAKRMKQENAERQARAEAIILQDPFVQSLMRDFDAKIVPGSIKPV